MTRLIPPAESLTVEFKSDRGPLPDSELVLAVVCLANAQGGTIYLGVEDDGTMTGLAPKHLDAPGMAAMIFNQTSPAQSVRVSILHEDGLPVAAVEVSRSDRPVGSTRGTYQRRRIRSDGKPECAPFLAHEMVTRSSDLGQLDYSALPVSGATMADLDPLERVRLRQAIEKNRGDRSLVDLSDSEFDGALGLVRDDDPTVGGLLLLGRESAIRNLLPSHEIAFQVLSDDLGVRVNDFYRLPLLRAFERVEEQFLAHLTEREVQFGLFRVPVPDVDRRAFREALVNAITHRDYSRLGTIHVQWWPEFLTVTNPGGFVDGVTVENILVTRPRPRNLVLADAFKRLGLSERTGRGVDLIYEGMLRYGRPAPSYRQSTTASVTVSLPCSDADIPFLVMVLEEEKRRGAALPLDSLLVLSSVRDQHRVGAAELAKAIQKDPSAATSVAETLVEAGLLVAHGTRNRTYTLSPSVYRALGKKVESVRQASFDPLQQVEMVRGFVRQHGSIKRAEAAELCRIESVQARRLLARMVKLQIIVQQGERRGVEYVRGPKL